MGGRVVLHIGAMKTGTSFLQSLLTQNPEPLAGAGARMLGGTFMAQSRAVSDVLNLPKQPRRNQARWQAMAQEAQALDGTVGLVSMEFLSFGRPRHVEAFLEPLRGLEIDVVLTVRDQFRTIPAQWQTYTRNFGTESWVEYLRSIEKKPRRPASAPRSAMTFHRAQDTATILDRWAGVEGVSSVKVITVPAPGAPREELWHRFCTAVGIPAVEVDLSGVKENASLGFGSCDLLRRMNVHLADVAPRQYRKGVRKVTQSALAGLRAAESKPQLDRRAARFAQQRNEELHALLGAHQDWLVGDLADLPVADPTGDVPRVAPTPSETEVRNAALAVVEHCSTQGAQVQVDPAAGLDVLARQAAEALVRLHGWDRPVARKGTGHE